jgi:spermidine synthase
VITLFTGVLVWLAAATLGASPAMAAGRAGRGPATIEQDVHSDYSHIRIKRQGNLRSMIFVRDSGEEAVETVLNLKKPYELVTPYCRAMFASYLLRPKQQQVLIVGLGGGAMIHFYQHYDPEVKVDAVEIDPKVVELADRYFETRAGGNTRIITDDAFHYFETNATRYDVIYLDAFLKPSAKTDQTGVPLRLKTIEFYKGLREKLVPGGIVVINFNVHPGVNADIETVRGTMAQLYVFNALGVNNIVVCVPAGPRQTAAVLRDRARELDRRFKATFSFQEILNGMGR